MYKLRGLVFSNLTLPKLFFSQIERLPSTRKQVVWMSHTQSSSYTWRRMNASLPNTHHSKQVTSKASKV